jgi:hypothetical protein
VCIVKTTSGSRAALYACVLDFGATLLRLGVVSVICYLCNFDYLIPVGKGAVAL